MVKEVAFSWQNVFRPLHIGTVLVVFALDQATKWWIIFNVDIGLERLSIWEPWFAIIHWKNPGGAFGLFAGLEWYWRLLVFGAVTVVALWLLFYWLGTCAEKAIIQRFAYALILGGAVGNLKDRILFGEVTDFIAVRIPLGFLNAINERWPSYYDWPTFNIADSAISVGIAILILGMLLDSIRKIQLRRS